MFTELANKIINEHKKTLSEGAITTHGEADNYIELIKQSISNVAKYVAILNRRGPYFDKEDIYFYCKKYARMINEKLISGINEFGFISFMEYISPKKSRNNLAEYNRVNNKIRINPLPFLYNRKTGFLKTLEEIDFNRMKHTLEHEFIHFHQYSRRKVLFQYKAPKDILLKYDKNKNNRIDPDEYTKLKQNPEDFLTFRTFTDIEYSKESIKKYNEIYLKKDEIAPNMSYKSFEKAVNYYNNPVELNTWAFEESKNYIEKIYSSLKRGKDNYSTEQIKLVILKFMNTDIFSSFFASRDFYKFLTTENKKKFFKYVYQILMNMDYPPIIVN